MSVAPPGSRRTTAATLALWLALVLLAVWQITRTTFVADLSAFLPDNPDARQRVLIEQVQSGVPARTLLIGIDGGDAAARAQASRRLAAALRASGLFEQVNNGETEAWAEVGTWLFEQRYLLSPAVTPARFTPDGLREAFDETLSLLGTPVGNALKPLLDRDPTGETQRIAESLIPAGAPKSENGVWVSRQQPRALLVAGTKAPGADLDAQSVAIDRVKAEFARIASPGLTLKVSGAPVFGVDSRARIETETHWLAAIGTVLATLLLLTVFASLRALGVAMLPVASGVIAGVAAVSLAFDSVHGITLGFGTTLIGEAVDYAIYYLIQARAGGAQAWLRNGWPTVRLGLFTSLCGFGALVFSGFPGLAQLGVFSVAGLTAAAVTTRFVLPLLQPHGADSDRGRAVRDRMGAFTAVLVRALPRWRWPVLALGVAALALLLQRGAAGTLWQADLAALSPVSAEALALDQSLRADLSAGDARTLVVVQGPDLETTLQRAEAAAARLEPLVERGVLGGVDSASRWLPSRALQAQRRAALPDAPALQAALAEATRGGPLKAERLAPFIAEVQRARQSPDITPAALAASPLKPLLDALLLVRPDGSTAALLMLQPVPGGDGRIDTAPVQQALAGLPELEIIELGGELTRLYARYLGEAQVQALLGALAVVALMALSLRSLRRLLAVCQPLLLAVILTMGGFAALGIPLGILHLVGLLLVVAVGSNYTLFFDLLQHAPAGFARAADGAPAPPALADRETLASLLLANVVIVMSFGLIALSQIPALSAIGRVVAPGALLALLLAAAFAPRAAPGAMGQSAPR